MMSPEKIIQRNAWLLKFFKTIFPDKIIIANTVDNPAVIYNYTTCLSCYVQNHELRFMDKSRDGAMVYSIFLSEKVTDYDTEKILDWYTNCEHRKIFKVQLSGTKPALYLSGYNFLDRDKKLGRYPVFSRHNPKIYMSKDNAEKVIPQLREENYDVILC